MEELKLTQKEYDEMVAHLKYIKEEKGAQISERIKEARSHGDLSENAEYDAAKAEKAANQAEIEEIESKMARAVIIDTKTQKGVVSVSNIVTITLMKGKGTGGRYKISNAGATVLKDDASKKKSYVRISEDSPVGKSLLGQKQDAVVTVKLRDGSTSEYRIDKIEQDK